ncbi:tRNA (adenosine(37)-N6)-threonylcarbamoyltransferase complex transferase subunit TsaD [Candidatus Roizmanbacteria bacterium RIFCSPLOWO2_01_FULL_37_12]|uniref:tRNA N6-adenosine threonylcarbamoyltransferase n=1 Tax=Candidatus Roizmanbacteria bacterium RIFCSPLOWO2_01_FULL_37_12 TaxID=1802056 RepID=A0A1F7IEQ7_9BACT|nr:MAG: tRNA (adenosine(37)-N6)-threonylcarbamoyltransferase complex transferase subunit TsaD [Candidatus Roizmanbacteria bacterium RIFCSPHIGHO2_02_FULL_37_9b]OGK41825.1 MAG: tRNA (adenosine(37)-N6)-threonylcarbamoyltransferase complex transferase subunit TsaD [Candidatus Roizmanbacteria bacterium RIFCSPLOWO2_01_FULL_37_12]
MLILAIETSADETAAAVTSERKVLSNIIYSQILLHKKWGGIFPSLAKRAHEERIDWVVEKAIANFAKVEPIHPEGAQARNMQKIDYLAVTQGPGLAVALEVGIKKSVELARRYDKKLIAVNHLEGHIYSPFVQNSQGNPRREFKFPYLALVISGGHTEIVLWKGHLRYQILGETRDDAAGEALDKAAKMLGLGYPGGPIIERLASEVNNKDFFHFPRPMIKTKSLEFSFSGLKTSFYYYLCNMKTSPVKKIRELSSSFQEAVFETLLLKTELAIKKTGINRLVVGGGVIANFYLRKLFRDLVRKNDGEVLFPPYKYLTGDNAAMIGVAAFYKKEKGNFVKDLNFDRVPRLRLS